MSDAETDVSCRECGDEIVVKSWRRYDASDLEVCTDCWFDELDGEERKEIAERANRSVGTETDRTQWGDE